MGLSNWFRSSGTDNSSSAHLVGLDLDSGRAKASALRMGKPRRVTLDEPRELLHLLISLQKKNPEIGQPGLNLLRTFPHLVCRGFLPALGYPTEWRSPRVRLDPDGAARLALERIRSALPSSDALALTLPAYLTQSQVTKVTALCEQVRLRLRGTAVSALALAADLATDPARRQSARGDDGDAAGAVLSFPNRERRHQAAAGSVGMIIDADDHALTASLVKFSADEVRMIGYFAITGLGLRVWKERLLDSLSDRCVRVCRRDPRDNADTEQALYEQLDDALHRARHGQQVALSVRSASWYQDLPHQPDDFDGYCQPMARKAAEAARELSETGDEPPRVIWFTDQAAQLPGLVRAVRRHSPVRSVTDTLPPDAIALAGARMAGRWLTGSLPRVHLDTAVPLEPFARSPDQEHPGLGTADEPEQEPDETELTPGAEVEVRPPSASVREGN